MKGTCRVTRESDAYSLSVPPTQKGVKQVLPAICLPPPYPSCLRLRLCIVLCLCLCLCLLPLPLEIGLLESRWQKCNCRCQQCNCKQRSKGTWLRVLRRLRCKRRWRKCRCTRRRCRYTLAHATPYNSKNCA